MSWDPLEVAFDGVFCDAFGQATDGYFCARPRIVSTYPRRREPDDLRDIADIVAILASLRLLQ